MARAIRGGCFREALGPLRRFQQIRKIIAAMTPAREAQRCACPVALAPNESRWTSANWVTKFHPSMADPCRQISVYVEPLPSLSVVFGRHAAWLEEFRTG